MDLQACGPWADTKWADRVLAEVREGGCQGQGSRVLEPGPRTRALESAWNKSSPAPSYVVFVEI